MKTIAKLALPAVLSLAAFGVQAQVIETDYPQVLGNVGIAVAAPTQQAAAPSVSAPLLVQSNFEGPKANPAYAGDSGLTRADVRASASLTRPAGPGHNA